ncbi:hypothetical protein [Bremerella alba]|uniref:Carboxypeptidase regulatory-like domain-containing protein n=1 Tax=Bremerella alba TaxID=980252 RepID=A0A7V8V3A5_9BACT|nr:hypothetical protein [Bremerella alba]MBA2114147.1 hypothetical protein [Bremerella alba]
MITHSSHFTSFPYVVLLVGSVFIAGCGEAGTATTTVTGKVTHKDKLLERGVVLFSPVDANSSPSRTNIDADGTYQIEVMPGQHKVIVKLFTETDPNLEPGEPGYVAPKSLLPIQYSSLARTPLEFTVGDEPVEINLEL